MRSLIKILSLLASLSMIPIVLLLPVFLPFKGVVSFLIIVLPLVIFIFWVVGMILSGKLNRKKAPIFYYIVVVACTVFWLVLLGISTNLYINKIPLAETTGRIVRNIYQLDFQTPLGLVASKSQKNQLNKDYLRMSLPGFLPLSKNRENIKILNYSVRSYAFEPVVQLFTEIFIDQTYFFSSNVKNPYIIDCGSNIGISILYFKALYPDARILGFEPAPENFKILKENIEKNNLKNIVLEEKAVSNINGKIKFYGDSSTTSGVFKELGGKEIEVEATKLSRYINRDVDLLKMDIEGAEGLVFDDLVAEKKLKMIRQMVFEYHHHIKPDVDELSKILKMLEDNNFGYQIEDAHILRRHLNEKGLNEALIIYAYQK